MALAVKKKNPAAVAMGRKGGKKGGPARAAKLTPEQRSDSARKAVLARWNKVKKRTGSIEPKSKETPPVADTSDTSKKALHFCLKRIKEAKTENELRRLTQELQRIVFHRQYRNAED